MKKNWHTLNDKELLETFNSDLHKGLQTEEALKRYKQYAPNLLSVKKRLN